MQTMPELKCDWATHEAAKYACEHWHYSKCLPVGKLFKIGAWEEGVFIGVVLFSRGATQNIGKPYGLEQTECVELTRIALRQHKHFVSEIMMHAIKKLHEYNSGIRLIVSYADPAQGHTGAIYQATNWIYQGHTSPDRMYEINGKLVHARTIQKEKTHGMNEQEYVFKKYPNAKRLQDLGKHKYLMPLDKKMRKLVLPLAKPYPKKELWKAETLEGDGRTFTEIAQERG